MTLASKRAVTVVAGLSGYGKNTGVLQYLANYEHAARFLFDPDPGEFNPDVGEFADRLQLEPTCDAYDLALHAHRPFAGPGSGPCWCFDPHWLFTGRLKAGVEFFAEFAWNKSLEIEGEKCLVVDEVWKYCNAQSIPAPIQEIAVSGRKRKLQLIVNTQQPHKLNDTFKNSMSEIVCFRLQSDKQLAFAKDFGFDPDEIAQLPPLAFVARNLDSGGELRHTIKV